MDDLTISSQDQQPSACKAAVEETKGDTKEEPKEDTKEDTKEEPKKNILDSFTFEEEEEDEPTIEVDLNDKDRVVITLTTGKKYAADRYCPHAGVDLSTMGKVSENDYPPEIGPVLMCTYHYWEFALDKEGRGDYNSSVHACPIEDGEPCPVISEKKELEW